MSDDYNDYEIKDGEIEVHGILIESRYNEIDELKKMIAFCESAYKYGVNHCIKSVFYDSKTSVCNFEFHWLIRKDDSLFLTVRRIADEMITQYVLCGMTYCPQEESTDIYDEGPFVLEGACIIPEVETVH